MATYYFHVSRDNTLRPGQVIKLGHHKGVFQASPSKRAAFIGDFFPDGITRHGVEYLLAKRQMRPDEDSNGLIEIMAEFIRRDKYPYRPSRFQSFFAWRSMRDAVRFSQEYAFSSPVGTPLDCTFWQVESSEAAFESDMHLLTCGLYWLDVMITLDAYWRQEYTPDPLIEVLLTPPITIVRQIKLADAEVSSF